MSVRTAQQSGTLRNFDDDSDVDEIDQEVRRPAVRRSQQSGKRGVNVSGDSIHDENSRGNRQYEGSRNSHQNEQDFDDEIAVKAPVRVMSMRRVVTKPNTSSNGADNANGRGFVPRDLSTKTKRSAPQPHQLNNAPNTRRAQNRREDDEQDAPAPWTRTPKVFLNSSDTTSDRNDQSNIPVYSKGSKPVNVTVAASKPAQRSNAQATTLPMTGWEHHVEGMDSDDEASAHTEESGDEGRDGQSDSDGGPSKHTERVSESDHRHSQLAHKTRAHNYSLEVLTDDLDRDPSVIQDGEFYEDFRARSLAAAAGRAVSSSVGMSSGSLLGPNKSGRYDQSDDLSSQPGPLTGGWMAPGTSKKPVAATAWGAVAPPQRGPSAADFGPSSRHSFVVVAHERGLRTEHVQCTVVRNKRASINGKLQATYQLILDENKQAIIVAQKMNMNRTSNYHLFDVTRPSLSTTLSKKSGNYLGKLRAKNVNRTEYVLLNQNSEREEIAGVRFDRITLLNQLKDGNQPRKMKVVIPPNNEAGVPIPNRTADSDAGSLAEKLAQFEAHAARRGDDDCHVFESKDPVLENGNYRLNFHGRVSKPSVKNFQMVSRDDTDNIICQFGKVDEDVFHLDFKAPITPVQAFAFALCQFNL